MISSIQCGSTTPCAQYLTQYPFTITNTTVYTFPFTIALGYNNLILPQPVLVSKGYFIQLTQETGQIAIDITNTASYSDLVWNTTTQWTKLAEFYNWRFYFNPTYNLTCYQSTINVIHSYQSIGLYTLSLTFLSTNKIFQQIINITNGNLYKFF